MSRRVAIASLGVGVIGSLALLGAAAMRSCLAEPERTVPLAIPKPPKPPPPKPAAPPRHFAGPCRELHDFKFAAGHVGADGIPDEVITWTYARRAGRSARTRTATQEVPPQLADRTPMIRITYDYGGWK